MWIVALTNFHEPGSDGFRNLHVFENPIVPIVVGVLGKTLEFLNDGIRFTVDVQLKCHVIG
jgi:hypothetical protein